MNFNFYLKWVVVCIGLIESILAFVKDNLFYVIGGILAFICALSLHLMESHG